MHGSLAWLTYTQTNTCLAQAHNPAPPLTAIETPSAKTANSVQLEAVDRLVHSASVELAIGPPQDLVIQHEVLQEGVDQRWACTTNRISQN